MRQFLFVVLASALASGQVMDPAHSPITLANAIQDKNFYVLSLLARDSAVAKLLSADLVLTQVMQRKRAALEIAAKRCDDCLDTIRFSDAEVSTISDRLRQLYKSNGELRALVDGPLRKSGMCVRYHGKSGEDLLVQAGLDALIGVNRLIDVYGRGTAPRYPMIDAVSFDVKLDLYKRLMEHIAAALSENQEQWTLFFQPTLQFGLYLLDSNRRDEAGRHEPLELGENRAAVKGIAAIHWDRYPYSVLVVPGAGTDRISWTVSPFAKLRAELAALRYRQGKAPLILVSGGYVHPSQTPFAEAIEMKRLLVEKFGVPENAILIDPHARHTTTNLRNAARQIYRYGIPFDKKALITTDKDQSRYIESDVFSKRCLEELGYLPHLRLQRVSPADLEFLPRIDSLQLDATDPLDP